MTYFQDGHFLVWCPEEGGETKSDAVRIDAESVNVSRKAAEKWMRLRNDEGQWTDDADGLLVSVLDPDLGLRRWRVTAPLKIEYTATEAP